MTDPVKQELARLSQEAKEQGLPLKAESVVDAAKDKDSPLHKEFEWDNKVAGQKFREQQARQLIRQYLVMIPQVERPVRGLLSVPSDRQTTPGYRPTQDVLANPDWRGQIVAEVKSKIKMLQKKYEYLTELSLLWPRLETTLAEYVAELRSSRAAG